MDKLRYYLQLARGYHLLAQSDTTGHYASMALHQLAQYRIARQAYNNDMTIEIKLVA